MEASDLEKLAAELNLHPDFKVIKRYKKPLFYNAEDNSTKHIGIFLDIEATGLSHIDDKLIELGMVKFEYNSNGAIFRIVDEFSGYQDPKIKISEFITNLTGIRDDMVVGQHINTEEVINFLDDADIIIAHNAKFDRAFFESTFPEVGVKNWACSMYDISWKSENIESHKLEYIAYKYNFFYEGHRAVIDCLVGIHILAQELINSKQLVLKQLLNNALQLRYKLWAKNAPYDCKDKLRERSYRWGVHPEQNFKAWSIEVMEDMVATEIDYLKHNIYNGSIKIPIEIIDAESRFSVNKCISDNKEKYADKVAWLNSLQQ